jgi:hypothetical protein
MTTFHICLITFIITLIIFLISLKFNLLKEIPMYIKILLLFVSAIPTWGFIIVIFGIIYTIRDLYFKYKK